MTVETPHTALRSVHSINGTHLDGRDGHIGKIKDVLADDRKWAARYFVVNTGGWLLGRKVLVSPRHIINHNPADAHDALQTSLTKEQLEACPPLDEDAPVSRRYEVEYNSYYDHHPYWLGEPLWGISANPAMVPAPDLAEVDEHQKNLEDIEKCHLRSLEELFGYTVIATDGEFGKVQDMIVDTGSWKIRHAIIDTGGWFSGKKVLIDTDWIVSVEWKSQQVAVSLAKDQIEDSPEFDPGAPVNRSYEVALYDYYGKPRYW